MIKYNNEIYNYINYNSKIVERDLQYNLNIPNNNIYRDYIQKKYDNILNLNNYLKSIEKK